MSYIIRWFVCECGKKHLAAHVDETSKCACGRLLYKRMWETGRP